MSFPASDRLSFDAVAKMFDDVVREEYQNKQELDGICRIVPLNGAETIQIATQEPVEFDKRDDYSADDLNTESIEFRTQVVGATPWVKKLAVGAFYNQLFNFDTIRSTIRELHNAGDRYQDRVKLEALWNSTEFSVANNNYLDLSTRTGNENQVFSADALEEARGMLIDNSADLSNMNLVMGAKNRKFLTRDMHITSSDFNNEKPLATGNLEYLGGVRIRYMPSASASTTIPEDAGFNDIYLVGYDAMLVAQREPVMITLDDEYKGQRRFSMVGSGVSEGFIEKPKGIIKIKARVSGV